MQDSESVAWVSVTTSSDIYGNTTTTEAAPVTLSALVAARSAQEAFDPRAPAVIVGLTLYLLDTDVVPLASDWFTVRGERYEVDGEPHRWGSAGVEVAVKRAEVAP
jgi:hypothetical protein